LAASVVPAQNRKSAQRKVRTTQTQAKKKTPTTNNKAKDKIQQNKSKTLKAKSKAAPQPTVKGLQNQRLQLQKQIKEQERKLQANRKNVKQRLENLQIINTEIADKRRIIDTIRQDLNILDGNIAIMDVQLKNLEQKLDERKQNYIKSMRYMHRNRSLQNQLMFIFSAHNFTQMFRRMRFTREYAQYQRAQGEAVMVMQEQMIQAQKELTSAKRQKNDLLYQGEQERKNLESKQMEQQNVVNTLQKEQKTIESLLAEQRKKDAALNAQIEKLIAEEVARAKARAEAEAKRLAEEKRKAAEAAAKKRAEELARKKVAAEAAARENARRIAEAKAREERAKQQALAAAKKSAEEKKAAEKAAREAEAARREAERKAAEETKAHQREMAEAKKKENEERESFTVSTEDRRLSGNFESNRGRLPMPISGGYRIVSGFGQHDVDGLKGVRLDNKGINIKGQPGAQARSIFDGEVCAVFNIGGVMGVMVRHGSYISVYTNLSSVSVRRGQRVSTRQTLGAVNSEGILQFQLRKGTAPQNPSRWLSR
jgi:septal ring factor EnvC (AmiA/AmiB activator)